MEFVVGDKVSLKHDLGPEMVVIGMAHPNGSCICAWFDDDDHYFTAAIPPDALQLEAHSDGIPIQEKS